MRKMPPNSSTERVDLPSPIRRRMLQGAAAIALTPTTGVLTAMADTMSETALSEAQLDELDAAMARLPRSDMPGIVTLVARDGAVHAGAHGTMTAEGNHPMRRDTIFRIASLTKPVSAALAMMLVEEGRFSLDEPVDRLLPELADRRVLRRADGPLDDTVPADRPILVSDLLSLRMGLGAIFSPEPHPITAAMNERGVGVGPWLPQADGPDDYIARIASLPLAYQPGRVWMYDTGMHVLGVLIERVAGEPLGEAMRSRLLEPLGMSDTGFSVPPEKHDRLPACYWKNYQTGEIELFDPAGPESSFAQAPGFPNAAGGLVSTANDYLRFALMMMNGGELDGRRYLSAESVAQMTTDQITAEQKARSPFSPGFWDEHGWGLGLVVARGTERTEPRGFGWDGGYGTSAYWDPDRGLVGILLTQRLWDSPEPPEVRQDFWRLANAAAGE